MKNFELNQRVAVVTGATGLIGRHHCMALSEAGAHVVCADLDFGKCEDLAKTLPTKSIGLKLDVTQEESVKSGLQAVLKSLGRVDILINNAAINDMFENPTVALERSRFEHYPVEMFRKMMDVNVTGMFLCSQIFGSEMARSKKGSIINISSTYGIVGPNQSLYIKPDGKHAMFKSAAYPASKGAVIAFTRFLAAYWGDQGVRVNTLSPGGVENSQDEFFVKKYSERTPLARMAEPTDYRGAVVFLASDASSYMTGANLVVDGGFTVW
jgi:NAD(P)-dependent dehydrogenase (short-subunit alcohol dehydrogenase family)